MLREFVIKGGFVMYPLLLCSVTTLAVALERVIFFCGLRLSEKGMDEKMKAFRRLMQCGETAKAQGILKENPGPLARVLLAGLSAGEPGRAIVEANRAAALERRRIFGGLRILDTVVTAAPLLGLLGTVTGILHTFRVLGAGIIALNMQEVGKGIAEALITTATGLIIAIPTLIIMNYFAHRAEVFAENMDREIKGFWGTAERGDKHGQVLEA
ncbi:MAG: MotA/TolQ/ExbB proton channel family protein [Bacteroidota bacterium]